MAIKDLFSSSRTGLSSPSGRAFAITAGASDLTYVTRGIYVGGAGDVTVTMRDDGASVTFSDVPAGTILPIRVKKVTAATASDLVGLV